MKNRTMAVLSALLVLMFAATLFAADLRSNILPKFEIGPETTVSNNDNTTGTIVDRRGFESVTFVIVSGTLADNDVTLTPTVQVCAIDNCADAASAAAGTLIGTVADATFAATDDNTVKSIGYNGKSRYVRLVMTPANNTGAARFSAILLLGHPKYAPAQ